MANVAVTIIAAGPEASGQRARVTGVLTLASDGQYASGGDSLATAKLALATVEDLFLDLPHLATGAALTAIFYPVVRSVLPVRNGTILIQAFDDLNTESSGDLSTYRVPFLALGVGI